MSLRVEDLIKSAAVDFDNEIILKKPNTPEYERLLEINFSNLGSGKRFDTDLLSYKVLSSEVVSLRVSYGNIVAEIEWGEENGEKSN